MHINNLSLVAKTKAAYSRAPSVRVLSATASSKVQVTQLRIAGPAGCGFLRGRKDVCATHVSIFVFLIPSNAIYLGAFLPVSFSLPSRNSGPGRHEAGPSPPSPILVRASSFIARIIQRSFLPSSIWVELLCAHTRATSRDSLRMPFELPARQWILRKWMLSIAAARIWQWQWWSTGHPQQDCWSSMMRISQGKGCVCYTVYPLVLLISHLIVVLSSRFSSYASFFSFPSRNSGPVHH